MGMGENSKIQKRKQGRNPRLVTLPFPVYKMEGDCFPVPENTTNKPDLP